MNFYRPKKDRIALPPLKSNRSLEHSNLKLPPLKISNLANLSSKINNDYSQIFSDQKTYKTSNILETFKSPQNFSSLTSPMKRLLQNNRNFIIEDILGRNDRNSGVNANNETSLFLSHQKHLKRHQSMNKNELTTMLQNNEDINRSALRNLENNIVLHQKNLKKIDLELNNERQHRNDENLDLTTKNLKIAKFPLESKATTNKRKNNEIFAQNKLNSFFPLSLFNTNELLSVEDLPKLEPSKASNKKNGIIKAYAANTHRGLLRNYNEDRVAIILNMVKPNGKKGDWPNCSFFAVYDGHGGNKCADFLRDNLHHYIIRDVNFPSNPRLAIRRGFDMAETTFIEQAKNSIPLEKAGSCALVALIINDKCYIANVGDSRALLSSDSGAKIVSLSRDHKPSMEFEKKRILDAGGQIYQTQTQSTEGDGSKVITGPHRVLPGRLSVSRTFGDAEAKLVEYGGNPGVIVAEPDIKCIQLSPKDDFLILGCDGIFDRLNNKQTIRAAWESCFFRENSSNKTIHEASGKCVENIMREALLYKTLDNITVVMITLKNMKKTIIGTKGNPLTGPLDKIGRNIMNRVGLSEVDYECDFDAN